MYIIHICTIFMYTYIPIRYRILIISDTYMYVQTKGSLQNKFSVKVGNLAQPA